MIFTMFPRQEPWVRGTPRRICTKFFEGGPLTHGSWWVNIVNRKPPRRGGVLSIKIDSTVARSWSKTPPPSGGFPIHYVPSSRTVSKRTPLEEPGTNSSRGVLLLTVLDEGTRPIQSIMYVPWQVNRFQKIDLLIVQCKYSKSCSKHFILQNLILRTRLCGTGFIT